MALSDGNLEMVRVVVLSPGDVAEERDTVALVVEELNRRVARSPGGLGLIGMRERAALHGGQLTVGPVAGGGFAVRVRLPTPAGAL